MENRKKLAIFGLVTTLLVSGAIPLSSASSSQAQQLLLSAPSSVMENTVFTVFVFIAENNSGNVTVIPVADASIDWCGQIYYTNGLGIASLTAPEVDHTRSFNITASKAGFLSDTKAIIVMDNVQLPQLHLSAPQYVMENTLFTVFVYTEGINSTIPVADASVVWCNNTYYTNEDGIAYLTAPEVVYTMIFDATASKEGFLSDTIPIIVMDNVQLPQLHLSAPYLVMENTVFTVFVYIEENGGNSSGNQTIIPVANASIDWCGQIYYTNGLGIASLTAPEVDHTRSFNITASKAGFLSDTKAIIVMDNVQLPQLHLSAPQYVMENTLFTVFVYTEGINSTIPVADASVVWCNNTYYTNEDGIAYLTAPEVAYTMIFDATASKEGFLSDTIPIIVIDSNVPPNQAPYVPSNPFPPNGARNVSVYATLFWTGGDPDDDLVTYDVYFGTSPNVSLVASGLINATFNPGQRLHMPSGHMSYNTKYYWKIVSHDQTHTTDGPLWCFTTTSLKRLCVNAI